MSETVTGALIVATFLLLTTITYFFLVGVWSEHSALVQEAAGRQEQRLETSLDIESIDPINCPYYAGPYEAIVENAGSTSFTDVSEMDVLVDYVDAADNKVASRLQHGVDWSISSITPDDRDPNLWNSAETAAIVFTLDSELKPDTSGVFIIAAPQGVTDSAYFTCPADPCDGATGLLSPTAQAADTGGNGNGFESFPANAFADDNNPASSLTVLLRGDRHRFYNYGFSIPSGCIIQGIEVRLDWWLLNTLGTNSMDAQLSWDGGASWTAVKRDAVETTSEHTAILGGAPIPGGAPGLSPSSATPISDYGLLPTTPPLRPSSWTGRQYRYITPRPKDEGQKTKDEAES